jgi:hypothetical protein
LIADMTLQRAGRFLRFVDAAIVDDVACRRGAEVIADILLEKAVSIMAADQTGMRFSKQQSLKMAVRIMLTLRQPIWIGWGKELTYFL